MKRSFLSVVVLVLTVLGATSAWAQPGLLISELCDPYLNYASDRFIEIYNPTAATIDLDGWTLVAVGNGGNIFSWPLSGDIESGEALVAGDATTIDFFPVDFADELWSANNGFWNGKVGDGAKLLGPGDVLIDYVVVDQTRFENKSYVRNADIHSPSLTYDQTEWTATPVQLPSEGSPGSHYVDPIPQGPTINGVLTNPEFPLEGDTVAVTALIIDDVATITTVVLHWGLSSSSQPNSIVMTNAGGHLYVTATPIPVQPVDSTVYYQIEAGNDLPATTWSALSSYVIPETVSIAAIQGTGASSPLEGETVVTSGTVTAVYGSDICLQAGMGPWNGIWASVTTVPTVGDSLFIRGLVTEDFGTTLVAEAEIVLSLPGNVPPVTTITTAQIASEAYEGVLVGVLDGACTDIDVGYGEWAIDDGSGPGNVGVQGYVAVPVLGTHYDVVGPVLETSGVYAMEPRTADDVVWVSDDFAPVVVDVMATGDTTVHVVFSEALEAASAEDASNYAIAGLVVEAADLDPGHTAHVDLTVSQMVEGPYTLTVSGVEDLYGNATVGAVGGFNFVSWSPPDGYYDSAEGLDGDALRLALHEIIDNHIVRSYDFSWTAFYTTDDKPNGTVWDMYSDVPDGIPPYEYEFGVDEGGNVGSEGSGYSREHSWPRAWFGGSVSPMESDLFALYPADMTVNGARSSYPYGEVDTPNWISLNGSMRGTCSFPGYDGVVFEPIDAYKGDFARTYFYMSTRYYTEDGAWPGSDMTDGADLLPWALNLMLAWHAADPVSIKELERNETVFGFQGNRNPFIDRPEFVTLVFDDLTGAGDGVVPVSELRLNQNSPNPFNPMTTISFVATGDAPVSLSVHDLAGRRVATLLADVALGAGPHDVVWDGMDDFGRRVASGVYGYVLRAGGEVRARTLCVVK